MMLLIVFVLMAMVRMTTLPGMNLREDDPGEDEDNDVTDRTDFRDCLAMIMSAVIFERDADHAMMLSIAWW